MANPSTIKPQVTAILKTKAILRFADSQTLSQALSKLTNSHDAVFVFDEKDRFIGVVSPYYIFKSRSYQPETKLKNVVIKPKKISLSMGLSKVAEAMIGTKVYYLPVLEQDEFQGIVTINRLFQYVIEHHLLNGNGTILFSSRPLVTGSDQGTITQTIALMKQQKVAKLPVVNGEGVLVGIVSQFDLKDVLHEPDVSGRMDRKGEKKAVGDLSVKDYMKSLVTTVNRIPTFTQAAQLMIQKNIGSLVIVDAQNRPNGIVTKRDLLQTIAQAGI